MIIDNLTATELFVEKKSLITITGNSTKNNKGRLVVDDMDNHLVSTIDSGDTPLYRLASYSGSDDLMLFNETTKQVKFLEVGERIDFNIDFEKGTQYFIGAKKVVSTSVKDGVFTVDLGTKKIFKIFLDGTELYMYRADNSKGTIQITGLERGLIDNFSQIVCWLYEDNEITDSTTFEIEFYNFPTIWQQDEFRGGEYFETFKGIPIDEFESTNLNQNVSKTVFRKNFSNAQSSIINSIENTLELSVFNVSDRISFPQYVGSDEFRLIFVNSLFGRVVLVNNCSLVNGISLSFEKDRNWERLNIQCGNYIDINILNPSVYGKGKYGKGQYGSGTWVYNSARREV